LKHIVVLWKQPSFKQTSEIVSAERQITQIIAQWFLGSWASNSECLMVIRAQTVEAQRVDDAWYNEDVGDIRVTTPDSDIIWYSID